MTSGPMASFGGSAAVRARPEETAIDVPMSATYPTTFPLSWVSMLLASRLSEMHASAVQTLSAEPAGTGGEAAAGPPAPEPEVHDAASATTPNAATQIRLTTADLPLPPQLHKRTKPTPRSGT